MKLSPGMQALVAKTMAHACPAGASLAEERAAYSRMAAAFTPPAPTGLEEQDVLAPGHPTLRCYRPIGPRPPAGWPTLLYLHGGAGWSAT
ncbi:hypothetical protein [Pseudomonas sp. KNUC1026]|uniref:hypothetical protein n=1 Tax=Pseudomonas sp. KNUC1026 TaxID=2893890 RepID=UPI001F2BE9A5|nr:hypothetical protein [Pseudomonas sp. KNUC1026]UFH48791.1 hypothetical protein LN139_17600 [Pseudomonas sp. KNUC1026]